MFSNSSLQLKEKVDEADLSVLKAKKALYHLQLEAELEAQIRLRPDWDKHIFT